MNRLLCSWIIASLAICCVVDSAALAQSRSAAELLPDTTVVYLETAGFAQFSENPLTRRLLASETVQQLWRSPDVMKLRGGITLAEIALGERLTTAATKLTQHGAVVAVDISSKGLVLLGHAQDSATCQGLLQKMVDLARKDAKNKGQPNSVKQASYRGVDAYQVNKVIGFAIDDWLVLTNQSQLGKAIVDRAQDSQVPTLAKRNTFLRARPAARPASADSLAWAWVDVDQVRAAGGIKAFFQGPQENFALELAAGGLLAAARQAEFAVATLSSDKEGLDLKMSVPQSTAPQLPEYEYFFGAAAKGQSLPLIQVPETLASFSMYRDLALLWRSAGDLFGQRTNDQLAQAETTLTTLFSGRDFGEEILGAMAPELRVVVAAQDFSDESQPQPQIKLPAFALITKLRQPGEMQPQLKRIFQSLIGFVNVTGAMNQQPQLDLETIKEQEATFVQATYAREVDRPRGWVVPLQYNFAPTLALWQDYAILASTSSLARATLADLRLSTAGGQPATNGNASDEAVHPNTLIHLSGPQIAGVLKLNRQQLISQNMLEKGHSEERASREIDTALDLASLIDAFDLQLSVGQGVELQLSLTVQPN